MTFNSDKYQIEEFYFLNHKMYEYFINLNLWWI